MGQRRWLATVVISWKWGMQDGLGHYLWRNEYSGDDCVGGADIPATQANHLIDSALRWRIDDVLCLYGGNARSCDWPG